VGNKILQQIAVNGLMATKKHAEGYFTVTVGTDVGIRFFTALFA
jgi:hypothetical protein